jgi:hypothetical protein
MEGIGGLAKVGDYQPVSQFAKIIDQLAGTHLAPQSVGDMVLASPQVTNTVPATAGEQLTRAAVRGAVSAAPMGPLAGGFAAGVPMAATTGAVGAVTGQVASDVVPDKYKPLADFVGNIAGGGLVAGGEAAMSGAGRLAGAAKQSLYDPLGFGAKQTVTDPNTGATATGTAAQLKAAGQKIAGGMGMSPTDAAASIPAAEDYQLVPGSTPTIGQATGNIGALNLERQLQGSSPENRATFTTADAANNTARVQAMQGVAPADAAGAAVQHLRNSFQQARADDAAELADKQATAEGAVAGLPGAPGSTSVQAMGGEQRAALEAGRKPAKADAGRALDQVDNEGTLALNVSGVGTAARQLLGSVNERMGGSVAPIEAPILNAASNLRGVELFSDLRDLAKNVSKAQRTISNDKDLGAESEPFRRMTILRGAIEDAMSDAVGKRAEADQHAVNAGLMSPEDSMLGRLSAQEPNAEASAATVPVERSNAGATVGGQDRGPGRASTLPERNGAEGQADGGQGTNPGNRGLAAGSTDEVGSGVPAEPLPGSNRKAENLHDFVISKGGVRDEGGEFTAQDLDLIHHRAGGRLINPKGLSPDYMRELAVQDRFLPANADVNDFIDAMTSDKPVHRIEEAHEAAAAAKDRTEAFQESEARYNSRDAVNVAADQAGVRLSPSEREHATDLHMQGAHPEQAIRDAKASTEDVELQRNVEKNAFGHPGLPPGAEQGALDVKGGKPGLAANFNQAAVDRLREANSMYARYKNTWRNGAVGDVLATGSTADGFRLTNSDVPGRLFRGGVKGAEVADSLIKAAGSPEAAQSLLGDYPAFSLRTAAEKDGTLNLKAYDAWMKAHTAVLDKFPDIRAKFDSVADAQREVEAAAVRHVERMESMQDSAARFYLDKEGGAKDVQTAVTKLMASENPSAEAASLMRLVGNDRAATDGVRRNVADWLIAKAKSTAEAGSSGEKEIAGGVFQKTIADPKTARALDQVFDADQMKMVRAIGKDIERAGRSVNGVKIKGSPGSAADKHALEAGHGGGNMSMLVQMALAEQALEAVGHLANAGGIASAVLGGVGAVGGVVLASMRRAGFEKIDQVAAQGVINPELGRILLQKAVTDPKAPILAALGRRMATVALGAATNAATNQGQ